MSNDVEPRGIREKAKAAYDATKQRASEITSGVVTTAQDLAARGAEAATKVLNAVNSAANSTVEGIVMTAEVPAQQLYTAYDHARQVLTGRTLTQELKLTPAQSELLTKYLAAEILEQVHGPVIDGLILKARAALPQPENLGNLPAVRDRRSTQAEQVVTGLELLTKIGLSAAARRFEDKMLTAPGQEQMNTAALRDVARGLVGHAVEGFGTVTSFDDLAKFASSHAKAIDDIVANYHTSK